MAKPSKQVINSLNAALDKMLLGLVVVNGRPDLATFEFVYEFGLALVKHEPWNAHLEPFDLFDIVSHAFTRIGIKQEKDHSDRVSALLNKHQFDAVASHIRDYLLSLPREYDFFVELPSMPSWGVGEIQLATRLALVEKERPSPRGLIATAIAEATGVSDEIDGVCLRIGTSGYGCSRSNSTAVANAVSQLKQFFQMLRRTSLYKSAAPSLATTLRGPKVRALLIDRLEPQVKTPIELSERLRTFLASVSIESSKLEHWEQGKGFSLLGKSRMAESREEKRTDLVAKLAWISKILDCPTDWPDADRIRSAFEWGFDSEQNDDQTLAFVQACIGLEAILGDDDKEEPLTARLADRCAYLLGKSHNDRSSIREKFRKLYDVRSKLVHGRARRLDLTDARQLFVAQTILGDVVVQEANNLLRALDKDSKKS